MPYGLNSSCKSCRTGEDDGEAIVAIKTEWVEVTSNALLCPVHLVQHDSIWLFLSLLPKTIHSVDVSTHLLCPISGQLADVEIVTSLLHGLQRRTCKWGKIIQCHSNHLSVGKQLLS